MKFKLSVIQQAKVVTFYLKNKKNKVSSTFTFSDTHPNYPNSLAWLREVTTKELFVDDGKVSQKDYDRLTSLSNVYLALSKWSNNDLVITRTSATYKGQPIAQEMTEFLVKVFLENPDAEDTFEAWSQYLSLATNPDVSFKVANRLFMFIQKNDLTITPEGKVLAWKVVRPDYKDKHSATYDNSVGQVLEMPRSQVDDDDNSYCSYGFHVCSWDYLRSFASTGDPVMQVEVDIKDIVAIPLDYNGEKVRVCKYTVVAEAGIWNRTVSATELPTSVQAGFKATA